MNKIAISPNWEIFLVNGPSLPFVRLLINKKKKKKKKNIGLYPYSFSSTGLAHTKKISEIIVT